MVIDESSGTRTRFGPHHVQPRVVEWTRARPWDEFVSRAPDGSLAHLWAWKAVMERSYGHRSVYLAATRGEEIVGVLPLVVLRSRLFGRHVVSMPFLDGGGLCTAGDTAADGALVDAAVAVASEEGAVLELRHRDDRLSGLPRSTDRVTMVLDLADGDEALWKSLPSNRRSQVRKGTRNGLTVQIEAGDALPHFYRVIATNMRDLGSPVHGLRFFEAVTSGLEECAHIITVRAGEKVVGAGLLLAFRDTLSMPWSSSLRSHFRLGVNQVLYWEVIRYAVAGGFRYMDFGRSPKGSGTYEAKREWGAQPVQLYWHYLPESARPPDEGVRRLGWAVKMWQRLPVPVATALGPRVRGGIPN